VELKRLTRCALLTAIALTIFVAEAQLPPLILPGMKLGLANIVTVWAMFSLGPRDTLLILLSRILLGAMFAGLSTLPYSLAGGLACYLLMVLLRNVLTERQLWVCGAFGAAAHNLGQMVAAVIIARTPQLVVYLPVLLALGILAGAFTGLAAQFLLARVGKK